MSDEMYLENLDEFVNDESKVVTYKWLSRTLGVHVNTAKQMLYEFTTQQRNAKDNDHLSVTYLVAGMCEDADGRKVQRVCVVSEEELEATKSKLKPVTSCHIYSVQKNKLKDTNSLYTADYDLLREHILDSNRYSAICYATAQLRVKEEETYVPEPEPVVKSKPASSFGSKTSPSKQVNKAKGKDAIAGMFAKAEKKKTEKTGAGAGKKQEEVKKDEEKSTIKKGKESEKASKPQAGVMSFFSKQAAKPKTENGEKSESPESKKSPVKSEKTETSEPAAEKTKAKSPRGKKNKLQSDEESESKSSKRRRVKQKIESSSDEDEEDMDEEPIPPTPPPSPPPAREPSPAPESPVKKTPKKEEVKSEEHATKMVKKGKKMVDRAYIDDEGFMVTEKVWEDDIVEVSDHEEPATKKTEKETKKTPTKQGKQKKSPTSKKTAAAKKTGKQMSLTSFFKKKD